jgi:hypothetical protein
LQKLDRGDRNGFEGGLRGKRVEIFAIAAKYGASNIRMFSSVASGDDRPNGDIDFLMELELERSLLDQIALIQDLEELLGYS